LLPSFPTVSFESRRHPALLAWFEVILNGGRNMTSGKEMDSLGEVNVPAGNRGMA
jgi:hypothetical protein